MRQSAAPRRPSARALLGLIALLTLAALATSAPALAGQATDGTDQKHTICHATGSESNPYVVITPAISGVYHAHIAHQHTEDIIPPFTYKGKTYSMNWDAAGQAIFGNGCARTPPPTDVCPNIAGVQTSVPAGMIKDANGNCVTPPTDLCPNIDGVQTSVPAGMIKDANGNCVAPPTDLCPNIDGVQATVPPGMIKDANGNCVTPPGAPAPLVDLAVTKLDTPDPVSAGNVLRYTIRVTNRGPGEATGVTVTDDLPPGVRLLSTRASQGRCSANGARITCRLGRLAVGASATVTVNVRPTAAGTLVNVARVAGSEGDPTPGNNTDTVTTRVVAPFAPPAAPACDSVTVGRRGIAVGQRTTLRIVVKSRGKPLARVRVRVRGAGIDARALTNRRGVALVSVRASRAGIISITVANQTCQRRIGAIGGSQPDLTG